MKKLKLLTQYIGVITVRFKDTLHTSDAQNRKDIADVLRALADELETQGMISRSCPGVNDITDFVHVEAR